MELRSRRYNAILILLGELIAKEVRPSGFVLKSSLQKPVRCRNILAEALHVQHLKIEYCQEKEVSAWRYRACVENVFDIYVDFQGVLRA